MASSLSLRERAFVMLATSLPPRFLPLSILFESLSMIRHFFSSSRRHEIYFFSFRNPFTRFRHICFTLFHSLFFIRSSFTCAQKRVHFFIIFFPFFYIYYYLFTRFSGSASRFFTASPICSTIFFCLQPHVPQCVTIFYNFTVIFERIISYLTQGNDLQVPSEPFFFFYMQIYGAPEMLSSPKSFALFYSSSRLFCLRKMKFRET